MSLPGAWVLHYSWGATSSYVQTTLTLKNDGTFSGAGNGNGGSVTERYCSASTVGRRSTAARSTAASASGAMSTFAGPERLLVPRRGRVRPASTARRDRVPNARRGRERARSRASSKEDSRCIASTTTGTRSSASCRRTCSRRSRRPVTRRPGSGRCSTLSADTSCAAERSRRTSLRAGLAAPSPSLPRTSSGRSTTPITARPLPGTQVRSEGQGRSATPRSTRPTTGSARRSTSTGTSSSATRSTTPG